MDGDNQAGCSINNPQRIEYEIVPGTFNVGIDYEWKVAALLSLRCLREVKEDWWIATQVQHVGAFDDLILQCGNTSYLLQLKHQNIPTNIKQGEFSKTGNFLIEKYVKSISKIKEFMKSGAKTSNITERFEKFGNMYFLLYTNRGVDNSSCLNVYRDNTLSALNTGIGDNLYKFNSSTFGSGIDIDCFNNLILFSSQVNAENIGTKIVAEIKKYIKRGNEAKAVAEKFITFFEKWRKCPLKVNFCLTKTDVACKLAELYFNLYKIDIRLEPYVSYADNYNSCKKVWNEIISDKIITVVSSDKNTRTFLIEYIGSEVDAYYTRSSKTVTWSHILTSEEQKLFYQNNHNMKDYMLKISGNRQEISLLDIYDCLWMSHKIPVLLELRNVQNYHTVMTILKLSGYRFKVILVSTVGKPLPLHKRKIKHFETLEDLEEKHREEILKLKLSFQGRPNAVLRDLLDRNLFRQLSAKDVIKILQKDFKIGNCFKSLPDYHIERALSKVLVDSEILNNLKDEILVVEGTSDEDLNTLTLQNSKVFKIEEVDFNNLNENCVIFSTNSLDQKQLEQITRSKKTAHMLTIYSDHRLKWKGSFGRTENLRQFLVELESVPVLNFIRDFSDKVHIISGTPGMGKSILLDYIAHKTSTRKWVFRIDLNRHINYYRDNVACDTEETSALTHLRYFKDKSFEEPNCSNKELENAIFEKISTRKDVVVLLDGFDEIAICYKEQVTNIAKSLYREGFDMWITTRPALKVHLEEQFNTFSTELIPFTKDNQKLFLISYFRASNSDLTSSKLNILKIFVEKLLAAVKENLTKEDDSFTGIPLQTKLLAEYFNKNCQECLVKEDTESFSPIFNLVDLYRSFIKEKVTILVGKHGDGAEADRKMFIEDQMVISLKILFPQYENVITNHLTFINKSKKHYCHIIQNAQRDGILTVDAHMNVNFVHQTFAEFLAAEWLAEHCCSDDEQLKQLARSLTKERFTGGTYKFLFNVFDRLLAHNHHLHLAIINRKANAAIKILNSTSFCLTDLDEGKRSVLHIAALYGVQHRSLSENMLDFILRGDYYEKEQFTDIILQIFNKVVEKENLVFQPDILGYNPFDYALSSGALRVAASFCRKLKTLSPTVNIALYLKEYYLLYSASDSSYRLLFNILLKYFVHKDLCYGNVQQNTTINDYFFDITRTIFFKYVHHWKKGNGKLFNSLGRSLEFKCDTVREFLQLSQVGQMDLLNAALFATEEDVQLLISDAVDVNKQDPELNSAMHYAALHGRLKIVKLLLSSRANIDLPNINGETALHFAIKATTKVLPEINQQIAIITLLSDNSANINAKNKRGETPLHYVFKQHCKDKHFLDRVNDDLQYVMALLVIAGADVNIASKMGETTLHYMIKNGYENILINVLLWTAGASSPKHDSEYKTGESLLFNTLKQNHIRFLRINTQNHDGNTLLHIAAEKRNLEIANLLLKNGASTNIRNKKGYTAASIEKCRNNFPFFGNERDARCNIPLHVALKHKLLLTAKDLISSGASINAINDQKQTILHSACEGGLLLYIPELLRRPSTAIGKQDLNGNTPLHISLLNNHSSVAKFLISKGADVNITNNIGETALSIAVENHLVDVVPLILLTTKGINRRFRNKNTCLHSALEQNQRSIVRLLIDSGADVNLENEAHRIALHCAAKNGLEDVIADILEKTKEKDKRDIDGNTPLHLALINNQSGVAKALLGGGTDVNLENKKGHTALCVAMIRKSEDIIPDILRLVTGIDKVDNDGNTYLHLALIERQHSIANLLIGAGAGANARNAIGCIALHYAVEGCPSDLLYTIVNKTSNIDIQDCSGNTPLHVAVRASDIEAVKTLLLYKANLDMENEQNFSPYHLAIQTKNKEIQHLFQIECVNRCHQSATKFSIEYKTK